MVSEPDSNASGPAGPEQLGRWMDAHGAALELYARQLCDCGADVVQEAFVELASQAVVPGDVVAWLYRVVRNRAISAARAHRRRKRHETAAAAGRPAWFASTDGDRIDGRLAADALAALPEEQREVVVAHLWGGLSFQQIGRLTDTSGSTAHRRYQAALDTLRKKLGIPCPEKE